MGAALFGYSNVIETGADDPEAIGAAVQVGDRLVRPPLEPARVARRLADGAGAYLLNAEIDTLSLLGIDVKRGSDGKHRAVQPVRFRTWFKPA